METEGLEAVHTSLVGNAVAPEGGSFLEPPSIAKVPGEEIFRKQIDLVPCLAEKNEKQSHKDEGFDTKAVVEETNQIAEQEQVADVTGTILKMDKIEGPCIDIGEEDRTVKHVEAMEDGDGEVEGKPKSIEKEIGGPKKYEEGETKIEESVELGTSKEVSSFEPSSSQGKEPLSQTADPTINNLDNPETGEGVQDKRNTEDIATATHETKEKQTEEMYSQQVDKPDVCMVSETESEENVNRSPQGEVQNLILEKTAEAGSSEGENIKDEMNPEQNPDGLLVKHEENSRGMEIPTVIAVENNTSDAVPITITAAQDHSVIADEDKIMDVVANIVPDHGKEEMSKYEDQIRETFVQQDEAVDENENSTALISGEIDTATSTECSEAIASAKEETPIKITGEDFEDKKEEKPIDTDAVVDSEPPIEKGLPPTDLNEKVEDAGIELQYKDSSELHISHSLEQETMPVKGEKKPENSDFEPQEQDHEANGQSKDLEKHAEDASEAPESMQNTDLENPSGEGAITTEVNSKANEMAVEREEKVTELESEEKLAIDDAGTNFEEEMQKKEEAHDGQTYEMATSDRIEEVTSDEVCSREFVDEKVERGVQAAGFQEAEIPLKNGVEESYEISSSVNEEVIDEPKIKDVEEVIDEEKIKDEATQLSSELVFEEKIVESSPDKETETEMSKGDDVEEQMMEDNNAKVILRESIQEASVNDGKNAEKSSREIYEVSEVEKKAETNNNDEIPDVSLQASLLKEQESLQTENLTAEAEEKDEDGSSIRKDEDEGNNNGLKEVKECSEKGTLKGEEDGEQISPKNEPGENLERSASMVSSGTGDVALNETTQKTEEEIDEGVEGIKKEAEIGKEDGEEQAIDENDDESIQVESIKEVPVNMVPNDENNAEELEGEIFEESVTAGTNVSFTDATYQNDGAPNAVLETSTVKQMEIVQGEDKDTTPAEASPEEEEEHDRDGGLKRFEENSSEIRLEGDPKKSDEETSRTIHAVAHEINQHIEFPNSTLETSPVEEQASLKTENPTPAENSPEGKKYEDASSNKKDEDKEMNTGIAEEKAEENLEQILQNSTLVENPKQPINMICAETEADASSKMVDNREEEIVEIPRGNAEAELLKEETIEGNVVEERNINSLSRESAEESPIKDFQNAARSYERSTEEMLESQIDGGDETRTNDEDCNSSLTVSVEKIDESFKGEDENITPSEASPQDEKEEHGSFNRADDGSDNNPELIVTNQDSSREALKVEEDFEQELQSTEPGEHEESSTVMVAETEAGTLSDKIDDITSQAEVVTIHNIEETVEKEKEEEHGSLDKEGEGNDSNPDLAVANQDSVREASEIQDDSEKELPRIEPGEPEEPSTIMASETEANTLSDKIDGITGQEEVVTIQNIEETVEKKEHGSSDKEGEGNDSNPDLTVANQDSVREASEVQGDSEKELPGIEPGEPEEPSTIMASETEPGTMSDKIDDITSQEEAVTIHNIEETVEKEKEEEDGSSDKEGEENDSNPDLAVANQDSVREASEVQDDSEKELPRIEPGEPEEPSTVMASETEANTLSDKIDDITGQEEAVTIQNIEETVEKEEHGSSDKEGEGNDSNPDLTVANQDSVREASEVQDDSEKELSEIEPREPEEPSTIMASETETDTLSDKINDITSQEEAVTIQNIEETVEKEEDGSSDKEGEGNDSNPDLTVANQDSVREASVVQDDSEKELPRIEPGEPEEPSTVMASETEADTLNDKIDDITGQEEAVTIHNIEETVEKEKKEGSEDVDVTKVERAVMEEDLKLVAEASDANINMENDAEESIILGGKEVETVEKTFGLDSIQKLEVEEKREHKVEGSKDEDIKEVCGDTKPSSLSVDTEKYITVEEHTNTDISLHTTGETIREEKVETVNEMEESVITSVDKEAEKKVTEEESTINDQSRIIYKGDESGMLVEHEVHEIIKDNTEVPLSNTNEENPLHKEPKDESDEVKPNNEVKDSKSEFKEPFEARGLVDKQEFETFRGKQGPSSDIYLEKASEGVSEKESSKSLNEISCLESESKGEILEEVQPDVNDSRSTLITGITGETSLKEAEPEDKRQIESFEPAPQEKGPVTGSTEGSTRGSMDIDAKSEDANFIENEHHRIPAVSETEELENEMHKETPLTGSEDYEETTNETPLGIVLDDKQEECSAMLPEEPELKTNEGNMTADENPTTYENIETPQTPPQEIEIMLNEDMPINERDASKSVDPRKESIKEDEYSSNVGDEAIKCIEATSAERKEVILEEDNLTKKPEDSLTENVEANKAVFELEERTNNQEQAIGIEDYGVLLEENFEVSSKKLEGVSETETGDQSGQNIPEAYSGTVENSTEIQNKSLKSIEQSSQESQEVRQETSEKTELRFETEGNVKETQNTDETVKDVLLTEEVHEKVDEAGGETLKSTEKDVNDTLELCAKSTEDVRVHEVNESSLIVGECHDATESNEQTTIISLDFQEAPTMEEMSLAKAINDEDNEIPAVLSTTTPAEDNEMIGVLSTTTPAEELDEMIKVIKEEDNCRDKIKATTMVEITETSLEEAQLDEKPVQVSNITSNDSISLEIEAEACQEEKVKDNVGLELPSLNLASQIPIDDHKNILREQVAKENADADDVQEDERASGVVYESKDHCIEELITGKIKEENEKSSEIGESPGAEVAANEAAIDQNPPKVISEEEKGISATTERREENMKGVEFREDDLRKTEDMSLQKDDDSEERDISQLELQPNKDIQNQSPNEVLEEECGTPGETKEEIKEGPKLVSMTNSQGFEALKDDESTSGHTVPEEKSEEQNQTPAVALLSKEKDCGTEMIMENIEEYVHVELPADPYNYSPPKITEDTSELEVSGLGAELNTGIQKDSLNEVQVEESKIPDDASKLQIPEYETSKETFESMPEVHGFEGFTTSEETEIKEKHVVVAITDLAEEENRGEKLIDSAEIMHDGVIEEGTFEGTSDLRTELSKEAVKSVSEVHGHEVLAESEDTEIKVKHPKVIATDMVAEENWSERTIDAAEIIHDKLKSEEVTKRETQQIMEEREDAKNGDPVDLSEETTKECQEEYELKAEESLGDNGTQKDIQNEELYKEVEKADEIERTEKQMDTERIIEHLHLAAAENETVKESFLDEAGSEMHLENQICGTASGNDGRTETANVKEEEMDVQISQKEGPSDLVEASEATRDIHEEEETSKTTTEHIEEHAKEGEIEVDELPSATMTAENTCSQKEETKEQEVCGSGVECNIDTQKNGSNEFDEETDRTTDEDSTMEPQGYENKIKDKEYLPESNKMTEITETGSFEKTSDLRAETSEETSKSVSEVHELEVLAESEHAEIKKEKHTEVAVTDLVAGENQNKKTIDATEVVHDELTNEEDKQQFKEGKEDTENCKPINLGEETTKESHQMYDLKAEKSHEDKMENEIQNEEEFGAEISEKESLQDPAGTNETTQDIHQGERDSDSTSEKPVPVEAETQETTERKKDAPQGLLQEPIVESTQGAEVGESEPGKATGIVDAQGFEPRAEIDEKNVRGNDESMSANISLFDMMQNSTRELQVKGDLTEEKESNEETRFEGEKTKSDEEKEDEEEGEEHKTTDSPVMVEASRDTVDVKVASKKHHNILSGVGSKVKQSISKVKKAITGKSSHPKQHSPK